MRELQIKNNEANQRLDKLLIKYMPLAGKGFIYKMIRKKNITLNDKKCEGSEILNVGDVVKLWLADDTIDKFSGNETEVVRQAVPKRLKLKPIYEDEDIVVFNKPAGLLSQKAKTDDISVNEILIDYLFSTGALNEDDMKTFKPSICNRLDRNTSGLIICGKSLKGLQSMARALKERTAHKDYIAFVKGEVREGGCLKGYLTKDERTNKVSVAKLTGDSNVKQKAKNTVDCDESADGRCKEVSNNSSDGSVKEDYIETEYKPLWTDGIMSILMVRLITGKTHQIRAHLASIGHPIIGDPKYGVTPYPRDEVSHISGSGRHTLDGMSQRQLLHAYRLTMPDGRCFEAEMPEDMKWEHGNPEAFEDLPSRI